MLESNAKLRFLFVIGKFNNHFFIQLFFLWLLGIRLLLKWERNKASFFTLDAYF